MDSGDNFWEESNVKGYNFDDDESVAAQVCGVSLGGTTRLSQQIKAGLGTFQFDAGFFNAQDEVTLQPNLHDLVPGKILDIILEADTPFYQENRVYKSDEEELVILRRQVKSRWSPPDVNSVLRKILIGQSYSLELFRSLNSKRELLKSAEALGDGDSILMVILFLSNTLNKSKFYQLLSTSSLGVQHYVCYLSTRMQIQEVTDLLGYFNKAKESSMKNFEFACSYPPKQLHRLRACERNHFYEMKEKQFLLKFIKLLEWEESVGKPTGESVVACLEHACRNYWDAKGHNSVSVLVKEQGVTDKVFQWVALNVKASSGLWPDVDSLFVTKSWLGNKRMKTELPMDAVVIRLYELNSPKTVLMAFLESIDNLDKRLDVAKRVQCHRTVIDVLVSQRDRLALLKYRENLLPQSEDYIFAEQALRNVNTKWKN